MKYYKVSEAANMFRVSNQTIRLWIKKGKISAIKSPGGQLLIPETVLNNE